MFFLNGDIFPQLKTNLKMLRSSPKNIVKSWAQNTPHILGFINALIRRQVYNKQKLLDVWKKDSFCKYSMAFKRKNYDLNFFFLNPILDLLQEYKNFLVESASDTALKWPPTDE